MQDICCKLSRTAAVVVILLAACAGSAWAATGYAGGVPWQVGDIIVCFGTGTCNVLRIVNGSPVLLDQFSDGLSGATSGVAINNTLHAVVTDNVGGGQSKVVVYSIASLDPNTASAVGHAPVPPSPFSANGGTNSNNAQAIAVNNAGHMFIGNAGNGSPVPSIVELNPDGTLAGTNSTPKALPTNPFPLPPGCTDPQGPMPVLNMDLSADGSSLYLTSGGPTIQQLKFSSPGSCTAFANFGGNVKLYGIKDIPAGALGNVPSCKGTACPTDEAILVVAIGNTDPDATTGETENPDTDAVNICTNQLVNNPNPPPPSSPLVSCALLLDTTPSQGLTPALWHAAMPYPTVGANILDPSLHLQAVFTAGTSGADEPKFDETGQTVIDNAVEWTDIVQPARANNTMYSTVGTTPAPGTAAVAGTFFVDPNGNLETVTIPGMSGTYAPGFTGNPSPNNPVSWSTTGGATVDGLQWQDQGAWQGIHLYTGATVVVPDAAGHLHYVLTPGTSGGTQPTWIDTGGATRDNAVRWTDRGAWQANTVYPTVPPNALAPRLRTVGDTNSHLWLATPDPATNATGISGPVRPDFEHSEIDSLANGTVIDGFQWTATQKGCSDGEVDWAPTTPYPQGTLICESTTNAEWMAATAGTSGNNRPAFSLGSPAGDNALTWTDQGPFPWQGNHPYTRATSLVDVNGIVVDLNGHVQTVVAAADGGTSGPAQPGTPFSPAPTPNPWTDGVSPFGGVTIDGLQWTDGGNSVWILGHSYNVGDLISDQGSPLAHVQKVYEAGKSGPGPKPTFKDDGSNMGLTVDNAVTWTESNPNRHATTAYVVGAIVVDGVGQVQQVSLKGITGPNGVTFDDSATATTAGQTVVDGLQWKLQTSPSTSVVARYPVTGTTNLQALALDPLITDCSSGNCTGNPLPTAKTSNFWLGDNSSSNVYKLDFATGNFSTSTFDANANMSTVCPTPTCTKITSIQGIAVYGGEGSNQPGLTKVLTGSGGTAQTAFFPLPNDTTTTKLNTNSLTLSLYNNNNQTLAPLPPFAVYGSSVPQPVGQPSCFFDASGTPALPCTVTTATGNAIVWKNDIPLNSLKLPSTQTLTYSFDVPQSFQSVNNNVFVDSFYNTTTGVGLDYPSGRYPSSTGIGTPVNANNQPPTDFGCTYQSPTPKCFKNPGTIPVKFTCNNLPPGFTLPTFGISPTTPWGPRLQIVTPATAPPAQFCTGAAPNEANATKLAGSAPNFGICPAQLPSSNGKTTYRFDSSLQDWVFNWSVPSTNTRKTYHICTYDDTHNAQTFCIDVTVASSCP